MHIREHIKSLAEELLPEVIAMRRHLHAHPELSWQEVATSTYVENKLLEYGLTVQRLAGNGLVAILQTKVPATRVIGLRADMDALPIEEKNEVAYRSTVNGVMHACGHDVHTANLLGTAKILSVLKDRLSGTYKFIFQPSEEKTPSGALAMIEAGALQNPVPDVMLGLHVSPELECGTLGFCPGPFMASSDEIYITVTGKGGHAARPHEINNPLYIAASLLLELKNLSGTGPDCLLNFGKIEGPGATNIVPDKVELAGTLRCFDEGKRAATLQRIEQTCQQIALQHQAQCALRTVPFAPVLVNNVEVTEKALRITSEALGQTHVARVAKRTGSEDFAHYTHLLPCCFFRLGTGNPGKGITAGLHSPHFDVDENALLNGMIAMASIAAEI